MTEYEETDTLILLTQNIVYKLKTKKATI